MQQWTEKYKHSKGYSHFDVPKPIGKCKKYIEDPLSIESHAFLPFIHYQKQKSKFKNGKLLPKEPRDIFYCSHFDRLVYGYYSLKLNDKYINLIKELGIDDCIAAYRNDNYLTTPQVAKRLFDFIKQCGEGIVFIGDFTSFFDYLDHKYLKEQMCQVLNVKELPNDWYAIFKSITKYSYADLSDISSFLKVKQPKHGIFSRKDYDRLMDSSHFHAFKKPPYNGVKKNRNDYGIPQGSPISATLSNVYMLSFDKKVHQFVKETNGIYIRYCDDFVIALPGNKSKLDNLQNFLYQFIQRGYANQEDIVSNDLVKNVTLQPEKSKQYIFHKDRNTNKTHIVDLSGKSKTHRIQFLGLYFDGDKVYLRDSTISRYYYKVYRKIKTINKHRTKGRKIGQSNLYKKYTIKGSYPSKHSRNGQQWGNFLTYLQRLHYTFKDNFIDKITPRHCKKIKSKMKPRD